MPTSTIVIATIQLISGAVFRVVKHLLQTNVGIFKAARTFTGAPIPNQTVEPARLTVHGFFLVAAEVLPPKCLAQRQQYSGMRT